MPALKWAIIAGEYPPQPGGVSDYTRLVANSLAQCGDSVEVWAPACHAPTPSEPGVRVHRLPGHYGPRALQMLSRDLDRRAGPYRILVQYVPQAFGWKGMNLPFAGWLFSQRHRQPWVMFHEVVFPLSFEQPLKHNLLGLITHAMGALVARAADRCFVAIPEWATLVQRFAPEQKAIHLLPVPSNVPTQADPGAVLHLRSVIAPDPESMVVGHFGTYGPHVTSMLDAILPPLLTNDLRRKCLLIGRGGKQFAQELARTHPHLSEGIQATGGLAPDLLAAHLAACDLLIQPYPDGASSRRGSLMAGLGLGRPIVTTEGRLTEEHWRQDGAVALVSASALPEIVAAAERLLMDERARRVLASRAAAVYSDRFALEKTVQTLRHLAKISDPPH